MKLVSRSALGWPASAAPAQASTRGVKVHYEGTAVSTKLLTDHDACLAEWKAIRASHLANKVENYSDVAYNFAACPHGYLLEGRGLGRRTGANGSQDLNRAHYAILGLVGSSGLTEPTPEMLGAIRDGIDLLRKNGAGTEIKGHRDGYATTCPGGPLYAWVQKGAPRPDQEDEVTEAQMNAIADRVVDRLLSKDAFDAPSDAADYNPDKKSPDHYWSGRTVFRDLVTRVRRISADTAAIRKKLGA
ncbi:MULTISPECIES: peptidoglycan recognition family protein [unclassified Streptomyces]|uniref:peptidoglycan recognition protein family protein n=1 Tax=unclassified Streptomyces TaxID=2593676 RepID=UPI00081E40C3|nr:MULTISPECIES: peptidoglycan recognition family protein [unclassified Streptomyces]SCF97914.1 hypothetical protein GA0115259_1062112 [Streptomyces sp. MnatMP-M17]